MERTLRRSDQRGLTLIEVMLSLMLLSFIAVGAFAMVTTTMHQNKQARLRSVATSLAAERIEDLTTRQFLSSTIFTGYALAGESTAAGPPPTLVADYGSITGHPDFRRVVSLSYNVPVGGMLRAEVSVSWRDSRQQEKTHSVITYLHPTLHRGL